MLRVLLRTSAACKVMHWARPSQSSWTSILGSASKSQQRFWAPSIMFYSGKNVIASTKYWCPAVNVLWRNTLIQRMQPLHNSAVRQKKRQQPEPPPRELDLLRYDMRDLGKSPKPAVYLGLAGLFPFVSPPLLMAVTETYFPELAYAQVFYGAAIISFLGGARWGFTLPESSLAKPDWINLTNSLVPPLLAWVAMLVGDTITPAVIIVIMGLGVSLHYDLSLLPTYPSWFKAMRAILTVVAFLSLMGTLGMKGLYPEKTIFSNE